MVNFNKINLEKSGCNIDLTQLKEGLLKNKNNGTIFEKFDKNGNGILEQKELNVLTGMHMQ